MNVCQRHGVRCYLISITKAVNMNTDKDQLCWGQALDLDAIYFAVGGLVASYKIT